MLTSTERTVGWCAYRSRGNKAFFSHSTNSSRTAFLREVPGREQNTIIMHVRLSHDPASNSRPRYPALNPRPPSSASLSIIVYNHALGLERKRKKEKEKKKKKKKKKKKEGKWN